MAPIKLVVTTYVLFNVIEFNSVYKLQIVSTCVSHYKGTCSCHIK